MNDDLISRKAVLDLSENAPYVMKADIKKLPTIPQTDSVLEEIRAEIENESIGYPPSADYYKAIKKAVRIIEKHISGKENE